MPSVTVTEQVVAVTVEAEDRVVVAREPEVRAVTIGIAGPQGIQGATGPAGPQGATGATGGQPYEHAQLTPSDDWLIQHNLGHFPIIQVRDSTGRVVGTAIVHIDANTARSRSAGAFSGKAIAV